MLYADDTVVLAVCLEDLQKALDMLKIYCEFWGLDINVRKTKVMIFSRGKIRKKCLNSILMRKLLTLFGIIHIWEYNLIIITSLKSHNSCSFHLQTGLCFRC